ncbi:helix-turn-helix domain-containing protein [Nocardia miyunensis]|uniref:helix-turn-helix domain-containing protein n=1 Tax=Nocardia miyunensis TaxID=282684 RepID=UPI0008368885|nr:helix-turn-helix domain-containing protein [Nocardia miyunensis]
MIDWILRLEGPAGHEVRAPRAVEIALPVLGAGTTAWGVALAARIADRFAASTVADQLTGHEPAALEASVLAMLTGLVDGPPFRAPQEAAAQVRWAARNGLPVDILLRTIWMAHSEVQTHIVEAMTEMVPPDRLAAEITRISGGLLEFVAALASDLSRVYESEFAAWGRHRSALIRRVLDELADGKELPRGAEDTLGIRLTGNHVAAVIWQVGDTIDPAWSADLARWADEVKDGLGAAVSLISPCMDGATEAVWSGSRPLDVRAGSGVRLPEDIGAAFGASGSGVTGLRDTLLGARRLAAVVRGVRTPKVWTQAGDGVLAVLLADPVAAADFVRYTLAGLLGDDERTRALRETLLAYLDAGNSRLVAAERLHIAATTVAYRVRQAAERLSRPIDDRKYDLMTALTLVHYDPDLAG